MHGVYAEKPAFQVQKYFDFRFFSRISFPPAPIWAIANFTKIRVSLSPVINHYFQISSRIFVNIRNGPHGILRGLGEAASWKNLKSKISCQTLYKDLAIVNVILLLYCKKKTFIRVTVCDLGWPAYLPRSHVNEPEER